MAQELTPLELCLHWAIKQTHPAWSDAVVNAHLRKAMGRIAPAKTKYDSFLKFKAVMESLRNDGAICLAIADITYTLFTDKRDMQGNLKHAHICPNDSHDERMKTALSFLDQVLSIAGLKCSRDLNYVWVRETITQDIRAILELQNSDGDPRPWVLLTGVLLRHWRSR